jgi:hypothetical protein
MALGLCDPSGPVVLYREGRRAKLREELVEAIQRNRLRRGDLDTQGLPSDVCEHRLALCAPRDATPNR